MQIPDKLNVINIISNDWNFWEVILCQNTYLLRKEAVKLINVKSKEEQEKVIEIKRNLFESSVLEYLSKSPYIVKIYDAEVLKEGFRINMEYLENWSIQKLLNNNTFLNIKLILKISECILHALEYAHSKDILHLDLKPWNILIENENIYKLSDFWLAGIKDDNGKSNFTEIYTMHYPPEKLSGKQDYATEQTDIYMLWLTLYRLLNWDIYTSEQWNYYKWNKNLEEAIVNWKFPNRKKYLPYINTKIIKIVNKCLNVDLDKRYKNIRELRNDFNKIKIKYDWIVKDLSETLEHWIANDVKWNILLELIVIKSWNDLWDINLFKYNKSSKTKITKYCSNNLNNKEKNKLINSIFNDFF